MPFDVARRRKDEIYEVMGELAGIVLEEDGSSWTESRKKCVEWTRAQFYTLTLKNTRLRPKLTKLVHTWKPEWPF